jgi:hypothetical protein
MKRNGFLILCAVTAVALGLTVYSVSRQPAVRASDLVGAPLFPGLTHRLNDLKTVVIRSHDGEINLDYDGKNTWAVRERSGYPGDSAKVAALVVQMAQMERLEPKTRMPAKYGRLELDDPKAKDSHAKEVLLLDKDGKSLASLIIGKRKFALGRKEGGVYVRLPDDPQTWLVLSDVDIGTKPADWLSPQITAIPEDAVKRVAVIHPDGGKVVVEKDQVSDANFEIANLPNGQRPVSETVANAYAGVLADLTFEDIAKADTVAFPRDKTTIAEFSGFDGFSLSLETTEKDGNTWLRIRSAAPGSAHSFPADLAARSREWIYQVQPYKVSALKKKMSDLVKKAGK